VGYLAKWHFLNRVSVRTRCVLPANSTFPRVAGEGFEPSLTHPESGSVRSHSLLVVSETAYLSRFLLCSVSRCSAVFSGVPGGLVY
jgi:hypothetical protein